MYRSPVPDATSETLSRFSADDRRRDATMLTMTSAVRRLLSAMFVGTLLVGASLSVAPSAGAQVDTDKDALHDHEEAALGTNPNKWDTDGDGVYDGMEVEVMFTNPLSMDTDGDGRNDGTEVPVQLDPLNPDTDGDGILDGQECVFCAPDPAPAPAPVDEAPAAERPDRDGDQLYDDETGVYGTNPDAYDTDGDGSGDGEEVYYGTDPTDANS